MDIDEIDDAFDFVLDLESSFINEGLQSAQALKNEEAFQNGLEQGKAEGTKLGEELGFYQAFICKFEMEMSNYGENTSNDKECAKIQMTIRRISRHLNKITLHFSGLENKENQSNIEKVVENTLSVVRIQFKALLLKMNLLDDLLQMRDTFFFCEIKNLFSKLIENSKN
ncbi:hypothetical protein RFI_21484 [Reticulomyxa filosa]|uniref:Essential protein Yae1 N-terminal domain-containing protein n=1 Tax=Reticulomyxa filosa TaxID=46433 RepID=X6MPY5_RETFI|nr:hypothetical protein RFI_21484 [Reticulomyxa filosa]|eukprot:ETO15879.1 hypothetical protein RFI_21484 [Reticulomyxa filosa]